MTLRVVELFAGIGAQRMALQLEGIPHEVVGISEIDRFALASYEAIYGDCPNLGDVTKMEGLPCCDLVTYSFPCQSISSAGRREGMAQGSGTKSSLVWEVGRLLETVEERERPEWLLMENVPAILSERNRPEFTAWMDLLSSLGYSSKVGKLNAKDFDLPQNRLRAFMISHKGGSCPDLPKGKGTPHKLSDVLETRPDPKYMLSKRRMEGVIRSTEKERAKGNGFKFEVVPRDGIAHAVTTHVDRKTNTHIREGEGYRKLTPRECWRLQGFPDWAFDRARSVPMSDSQLYKQAGNTIAVNVLRSVFHVIEKGPKVSQCTLAEAWT